ncbi:hypothetical protein HYX00_01355 [Candidatus Woesearchaeota archaeon]|nr:hypothetical protein [Candidatus Woesearchaeota archaeon]
MVINRQVFESLVIAKYCSLYPESKVFADWYEEKTINLTRDVVTNIKNLDIRPFRDFWKMLNGFTHPTRSSQQPLVIFHSHEKEIRFTYNIIIILLACNYHLLNRHMVTSSMKHYLNCYFENEQKTINSERRKIQNYLLVLPKVLANESKKVINTYKRNWLLK